jgi:hypothetical protein
MDALRLSVDRKPPTGGSQGDELLFASLEQITGESLCGFVNKTNDDGLTFQGGYSAGWNRRRMVCASLTIFWRGPIW